MASDSGKGEKHPGSGRGYIEMLATGRLPGQSPDTDEVKWSYILLLLLVVVILPVLSAALGLF